MWYCTLGPRWENFQCRGPGHCRYVHGFLQVRLTLPCSATQCCGERYRGFIVFGLSRGHRVQTLPRQCVARLHRSAPFSCGCEAVTGQPAPGKSRWYYLLAGSSPCVSVPFHASPFLLRNGWSSPSLRGSLGIDGWLTRVLCYDGRWRWKSWHGVRAHIHSGGRQTPQCLGSASSVARLAQFTAKFHGKVRLVSMWWTSYTSGRQLRHCFPATRPLNQCRVAFSHQHFHVAAAKS